MNGLCPSIELIAVSWRSPRTIERSAASWQKLGTSLVQGRRIWFQEINESDYLLAAGRGCVAVGSTQNVGLGAAFVELVRSSEAEYLLFLECDWLLTGKNPNDHLRAAVQLIQSGGADVVRLRSIRRPGWPVNSIVLKGRELDSPEHLLQSCFWRRRPDRTFPSSIERVERCGEAWYIAEAACASWTNNAFIAKRSLLSRVVERSETSGLPLEAAINEWWPRESSRVAQGRGLFSHRRWDGPSASFSLKKEFMLEAKLRLPASIYQALRG